MKFEIDPKDIAAAIEPSLEPLIRKIFAATKTVKAGRWEEDAEVPTAWAEMVMAKAAHPIMEQAAHALRDGVANLLQESGPGIVDTIIEDLRDALPQLLVRHIGNQLKSGIANALSNLSTPQNTDFPQTGD